MGKGNDNPNNTFYFEEYNNTMYICGTNGELTICKGYDGALPVCTVRAKELLELLKSLGSDEVDMCTENEALFIRTEDSSSAIQVHTNASLLSKFTIGTEWSELPPDFLSKLAIVSKSTADPSNVINGLTRYVYAFRDDIAATNKIIASHSKLSSSIDVKMFIKRSVCKTLTEANITKYTVRDDFLQFYDDDGVIYIIHTLSQEERFPWRVSKEDWSTEDWERMYHVTPFAMREADGTSFKFSDVSKITKAIKRSSLFAKTDQGVLIDFIAEGSVANIRGVGKYGKSTSSLTLSEPVPTRISARFEADLLKDAVTSGATLKLCNGMLTLEDSEGVFHVIVTRK